MGTGLIDSKNGEYQYETTLLSHLLTNRQGKTIENNFEGPDLVADGLSSV